MRILARCGLLLLLVACAVLVGCSPSAPRPGGVELAANAGPPSAGMTFELRFDQAMAKTSEVGAPLTNSPLVIRPKLSGAFAWLSPRSGVFTPSEPLELDTRYELSLRGGLIRADGSILESGFHETIMTPPFGLNGAHPDQASTNANSEPEIKLVFNANVRAKDAGRFMFFQDSAGRKVQVEAQQGFPEDLPRYYEWSGGGSLRTWEQEFVLARRLSERRGRFESEPATNELPNLVLVSPRTPLPLGRGWKLVIEAGLPASDHPYRLRQGRAIPVGDVTPFEIVSLRPHNWLYSGPSLSIEFSKRPSDSLTNELQRWLQIEPAPTNLLVSIEGKSLNLRGDFKSQSTYLLDFKPGFPAAEPFSLSGTNRYQVTMPSVPPRLYFSAVSRDQLATGQRTFPLLAVNVANVRVRAKLMDAHTAIHGLRGFQSYQRDWRDRQEKGDWNEYYHALDYNVVPGRTVFDQELDVSAALDEARRVELSWDRILGTRKTGVVLLEVERNLPENEHSPRLGTQALIQLTDLGMVWKRSKEVVQCLVFSEATGLPVPAAKVRLYTGENQLVEEALTDTNGWANLPYHEAAGASFDTFEPPSQRAGSTNAAWIAVEKGEDFHALPLNEYQLGLYGFGTELPYEHFSQLENLRRILLFSDRNLYRPGEEVHLEIWARQWAEGKLEKPQGLKGVLECFDSQDRKFFETNVVFADGGSFSTLIQLPTTSLGMYSARLRFGTNVPPEKNPDWRYQNHRLLDQYEHTFRVQDFQPSAFEVSVPAKPVYEAGDRVEIPVSARYFFGKPLSRASIKWSLNAEDYDYQPKGYEGFQFHRTELQPRRGQDNTSFNASGQGTISGNSNLVVAPQLTVNPVSPQPREVSLLVEVTDVNQQTLSRRVEFIRHSSDFYLGLSAGSEVVEGGQAPVLKAVALGTDEKPWPKDLPAQLTLQHVEWQNVRVQGAGRTVRYHNEPVVTNVFASAVTLTPLAKSVAAQGMATNEEAPAQLLTGLPALAAGAYVAELKATDSAGRPVAASFMFSVVDHANLGWNFRNETILTLKHDRPVYAPGETADLLIQAPFSGSALVTVERDKVLRTQFVKVEGNAPVIHLPIEAGDVPNVFVSVTLLRGAADSSHQVRQPEYRVGYCNLQVALPENQLQVRVVPGATNSLPGQIVEVSTFVTDGKGQAVPGAEVVLYAVDDGVLTLGEYGAPDPFRFFYATRPLGVQTSISLPNLFTEDVEQRRFENKGYLGGGGGQERVRKNFLACAFWNASLVADADGRVKASFPAPDSLTRYRVFAVVRSGVGRFGRGESAFQVSKPLVIEPALPMFANIADHLIARGVVQNQTTNPAVILATLTLDDTAIFSSQAVRTQRVSVAAGGSVPLEFPVEFVTAGTAKWQWRAQFEETNANRFADAVESRLEVGHLSPLLHEVLLSRSTGTDSPAGGKTNLLAAADPQLLAGTGTVTVTIANTRLAELSEAVSQLLHYPYGCVEQTGSALLPWILLRNETSLRPALEQSVSDLVRNGRAGRRSPRVNSPDEEIKNVIRTGVARLFTMQTQSGGLGYWPGAREPMPWASAYGGMVLALAQRNGIEVPKKEFAALLKYLSQQLRSANDQAAELPDQCLSLYCLALAGQAEPGYQEKLFEQREKLTTEDRALLALAISEGAGSTNMVEKLLQPERSRNSFSDRFGCEARSRSLQLLAWLHRSPASPVVDQLVNQLMSEQQQAHWGTTQGDAWALLALTEYARRVEGAARPGAGQLVMGDKSIPFRVEGRSNVFSQAFALNNLPGGKISLVNEAGSPLYATVSIVAYPPEKPQPRQDRGFGLQRIYQRLDDENHPQPAKDLHVGDRVLVTLKLNVAEAARYVVIDDALPAILEAVNPEFKSHAAREAGVDAGDESFWAADFHELRKDRCLTFADWVPAGDYTWSYIARVRAAGVVNAPSAKVEEMYHPERHGLSGSQVIESAGQ